VKSRILRGREALKKNLSEKMAEKLDGAAPETGKQKWARSMRDALKKQGCDAA
jgi:hypothetical protein